MITGCSKNTPHWHLVHFSEWNYQEIYIYSYIVILLYNNIKKIDQSTGRLQPWFKVSKSMTVDFISDQTCLSQYITVIYFLLSHVYTTRTHCAGTYCIFVTNANFFCLLLITKHVAVIKRFLVVNMTRV